MREYSEDDAPWVWPTLLNGFENAEGLAPTGYYQTPPDGRVFIDGHLVIPAVVPPVTIFRLDPGFRPAYDEPRVLGSLEGDIDSPRIGGRASVEVHPNGEVVLKSFEGVPGGQTLLLRIDFRA